MPDHKYIIDLNTGVVTMPGVETGVMSLVKFNLQKGLFVFHIKGGAYWSSRHQSYAPSKFQVCVVDPDTWEHDGDTLIFMDSLFGLIDFPVRSGPKNRKDVAVELKGKLSEGEGQAI